MPRSTAALANPDVRRFFEKAVEAAPSSPFLSWQNSTWTYEEFDAEINRAAHAWHALGVRRGDRVAFLLRNQPEYLAAWLGLSKIGAVLTGLNPELEPDGLQYSVTHTEPAIILAENDLLDAAKAASGAIPGVRHLALHDDGSGGPTFAEAMVDQDTTAPDVDIDPEDVVSLIFTSGTSGRPKAVMQTHRTYVLTGESYPHWLGMEPSDALYLCLPLFHVNGQAYATMGVIGAGARLALAERFSASSFWADVRRHGATMINMVGAMLIILDRRESDPHEMDNEVRLIYSASAVTGLSAGERARIEQRYGARLLGGYGMSECTFGCIEPLDGPKKEGSMGLPRQHPDPTVRPTEVKVIREDGSTADVDEPGELLLRSPAIMKGYFHDAEATATVLRDGWLHTGDIARRDADGFFFFVDRKKDVIRRRGENLYAGEVAEVLADHPRVAEAAVVGIPSEFMDDDVFALIVPDTPSAPVDPRELIAWTQERLAEFKVPRFIHFVGALPRTSTNKLSRSDLRELATANRGNAFDHERERAEGHRHP